MSRVKVIHTGYIGRRGPRGESGVQPGEVPVTEGDILIGGEADVLEAQPKTTVVRSVGDLYYADKTATEQGIAAVKSRVIDLADYIDVTGTSDGTSGFESALSAAASAVASDETPTLYLRNGSTLKLSGTPDIPDTLKDNLAIIGDGPWGARILQTVAAPAILADPNTTPANATRRYFWRLENLTLEGPGKSVSGSVGIRLNNALQGNATNVHIRGFETNLWIDSLGLANGAAAYYNTFVNVQAVFGGIGYRLTNIANANTFHGGMAAGNDVGVFIEGASVGNHFFGTDIESNTQYGARIQGNRNQFYCYFENHDPAYDVWFDESAGTNPSRNVIDGFMSSDADRIIWDAARNNVVRRPGNLHLGAQQIDDAYSVHAKRITAKSNQALYEGLDDFSGSGNPIGYRYRTRRRGYRNFHAEYSADGTTWYDTWKLGNHPSAGNAILYMSDGTSAVGTQIIRGAGSPEGVWPGRPGDLYLRTDGGAGTSLYVKETGAGTTTGWVAK